MTKPWWARMGRSRIPQYTIGGRKMGRVETFEYKLAGMRKPDNWIVCPVSNIPDNELVVQGRRAIAHFDRNTRKGLLNWRGSNSKYFVHLHQFLGAELFTFPKEFVRLAVEFQPKSGDLIGASPETGPVYVACPPTAS